jgi:hypothetical protein
LKTENKYPFAFDPVTGEHGFKKTHRARLSDEEKKALKAVEDRLNRRTKAKPNHLIFHHIKVMTQKYTEAAK